MKLSFSKMELADMARFDRRIDTHFKITKEEREFSRRFDAEIRRERRLAAQLLEIWNDYTEEYERRYTHGRSESGVSLCDARN